MAFILLLNSSFFKGLMAIYRHILMLCDLHDPPINVEGTIIININIKPYHIDGFINNFK